ncbi:substrate-binding periplasmic protein [Oceanobacter kriegii]|uniref:substrate-binding periplasmic protein n=1 Tax=Oceanobacter kriegii TaxID=64972 RepID=UPI0004843D7F|nr:ABC transporter substrate-binding protein [Oceanobacter kriegii]
MKTLSAVLLSTLISTGFSAAAAAESISLFTTQYPPYTMTTSGEPFAHKASDIDGLCTAIVKHLFAEADVDYTMRLRNWSYGMQRVQKRSSHGLFCTVRTAEREKLFQWVGPITEMKGALFAASGSSIEIDNLEDARQYRIGGFRGDFFSEYLIAKGFDIDTPPSDAQNPKRLKIGAIDLWISDAIVGPYMASDMADMPDIENKFVFTNNAVYLAISVDTPKEAVRKLQSTLDRLRKSGELVALEQSYGL